MLTNKDKKEKDVEVYIGARDLKDQIDLIMPTYELMKEHIETIRIATVKNVETLKGKNDYQLDDLSSKKEINNTIGIFGARGTGKTSAIHTLRAHLSDENQRMFNIILPIIEPDNFGDNTKIMGSIVGLLEKEVDKLLKKIEKQMSNAGKEGKFSKYFNNCVFKLNNPLRLKMNELIEYHLYTESEYRMLLTQNYDDLATHIKKSSRMLIPDIEFKHKLRSLVDTLIHTQQEYNEQQAFSDVQGILLFIFIDDIDLKTTKTREVVDSILQYANHPNIVTVLSGDYDILTESLTTALLQDENLHLSNLYPNAKFRAKAQLTLDKGENKYTDIDINNMTILQRKWNLSHEYLKKIIPPARRHQLVNWNTSTIPYFSFGEFTLMSQLSKLMGNESIFSYVEESKNDREGEELPVKNSYVIFDKKPRGLVNVYYHVHQINEFTSGSLYKELSKEEQERRLFQMVKALVDTIILSSTELAVKQREFMDKFFRWGDQVESTFIDYEAATGNDQDIMLAVTLIGELVRSLLPKIRFNETSYNDLKRAVFERLGKIKINEEIPLPYSNYLYYSRKYYLYYVVLGITAHTKIKTGMLLIDELLTQTKMESYYYKDYFSDERIEKERFVFMCIFRITQKDNTFLHELYYKSYNEDINEITVSLNFLNDVCSTSSRYSFVEKLFQPVLSQVETGIKLLGELYSNFDTTEISDMYMDVDATKILIINTLVRVMYEPEIFKFLDDIKFKSNKDYNTLIKINKENSEIDYYNRTIKQLIDKIIKKIGTDFVQKLKQGNYNLQFSPNFASGYKKFQNSISGGDKTIYSIAKEKIKKITNFGNEMSVNNYKAIFSQVQQLSQNNRVWYGRMEASSFLSTLRNEVYFNPRMLFMNEPEQYYLLRELAVHLQRVNPSIQEDQEYQVAKEILQKQLEQAFEDVKSGVQRDLEQIGQDLTAIEPSGEEDVEKN
ncbi:P-loop NTPase fold protein [Paenibacillus sp. QZ-Y1]|uniref:P-loop NTPase fold protein n=1 Tax=Paenibacillus sp. QZ-Y1 TaxID=3414511 RepID=UPI003F79EBD9